MAAPSKAWVVIADSQVDADSPLDTTLMTGVRDDLIHLEEWLGKNYTAAQDHNHDGVNSKVTNQVAVHPFPLDWPETATGTLTASTWTTYMSSVVYIPTGANNLHVRFRMKSASGTESLLYRLKIGANTGSQSGPTDLGATYAGTGDLEVAYANLPSAAKGAFVTLEFQLNPQTGSNTNIDFHKTNNVSGENDYVSASYTD